MKFYEEPEFELLKFTSDIITDSNMTNGGGATSKECGDDGLAADGSPCMIAPDD